MPDPVSIVLGFFLPPVLAIINQERWSAGTKSIVAFVVTLLLTVFVSIVNGHFGSPLDLITSFGAMYITTVATYEHLWKPTGVTDALTSNVFPGSAPSSPPPIPPNP